MAQIGSVCSFPTCTWPRDVTWWHLGFTNGIHAFSRNWKTNHHTTRRKSDLPKYMQTITWRNISWTCLGGSNYKEISLNLFNCQCAVSSFVQAFISWFLCITDICYMYVFGSNTLYICWLVRNWHNFSILRTHLCWITVFSDIVCKSWNGKHGLSFKISLSLSVLMSHTLCLTGKILKPWILDWATGRGVGPRTTRTITVTRAIKSSSPRPVLPGSSTSRSIRSGLQRISATAKEPWRFPRDAAGAPRRHSRPGIRSPGKIQTFRIADRGSHSGKSRDILSRID